MSDHLIQDLRHMADCLLLTTHHLTCTCGAHGRWRDAEILRHSPTCAWVANVGYCNCGRAGQT